MPDVLSLPLQLVLVESINRLAVTLDEPSAVAAAVAAAAPLAGDELPDTRADDAPLLDEAVPLEPIPDEDECSCCHGGMISLLLSRRLASSNVIFFLSAISSLAKRHVHGASRVSPTPDQPHSPCSMADLPPSSVPNGSWPLGVRPFKVRMSSLCSLQDDGRLQTNDAASRRSITSTWRSSEPSCRSLALCSVSLLCVRLMQLKWKAANVSFSRE